MLKKILLLLFCHAVLSLIGMYLVLTSLPPLYGSESSQMFSYFVIFFSILSGPLAAIVLLQPYYEPLTVILPFLIGIVCGSFEVYLIKKDKVSVWSLSVPVTLWTGIGAYSMYLSMAAAI